MKSKERKEVIKMDDDDRTFEGVDEAIDFMYNDDCFEDNMSYD